MRQLAKNNPEHAASRPTRSSTTAYEPITRTPATIENHSGSPEKKATDKDGHEGQHRRQLATQHEADDQVEEERAEAEQDGVQKKIEDRRARLARADHRDEKPDVGALGREPQPGRQPRDQPKEKRERSAPGGTAQDVATHYGVTEATAQEPRPRDEGARADPSNVGLQGQIEEPEHRRDDDDQPGPAGRSVRARFPGRPRGARRGSSSPSPRRRARRRGGRRPGGRRDPGPGCGARGRPRPRSAGSRERARRAWSPSILRWARRAASVAGGSRAR